jgi:diguanylate cyclase (GGDEF)-like protein/PAS domain S-box-containing protein
MRSTGTWPAAWRRLGAALPQGRDLSAADWDRRHRAIVVILGFYTVGLVAFGVLRGAPPLHVILDTSGVVLLTAAAAQPWGGRRLRSTLASLALLTAASVGVHLSGGSIEAHFAFFVVISLLMLYQDWLPFLIAIAFVVAEHGIGGIFIPTAIYNHPAAQSEPWLWAGIHGAFVLAASAANLAHWRLSEDDLRKAQASDRSYRRLFAGNPQPMWVFDTETHRFLDVNDAALSHYGYTRDEFLRMSVMDLRPAEDRAKLAETIAATRDEVDGSGPWRHLTKSGDVILARISAHPVQFGERSALHVMAEDVTERELLSEQLRHQAFHDLLTGLPNRALLVDRLSVLLQHVRRSGSVVAVFFCDLDGFKPVNDSLGHAVGDELLSRAATRLAGVLRSEDTLARVGGDEFIAACEVQDELAAVHLAQRLTTSLDQPLEFGGHQVRLSASVGIAIGTDPRSAEELVRNADIAMYRAKRETRGGFAMFDQSMHSRMTERLSLEQELRPAIGRDEFRIHYQPLVSAQDRQLHSFEALVRWEHPRLGMVPPADFIGIAEDSGFILTLGAWVLGEACRQLGEWHGRGLPQVGMGVNVSAHQLADPGLCGYLESTLRSTGLAPERLTLEVTESVLMANMEASFEVLHAIKSLGVSVSIDDFGTGYSSLAYLSRMPLDFLKIDRSFVSELETNPRARIVATTVVNLARELGVQSVAEGVETEAQGGILVGLGCDLLQGYHFGRPQPAALAAAMWMGASAAA